MSISATARWPYRARNSESPCWTTLGSDWQLYMLARSPAGVVRTSSVAAGFARIAVASSQSAASISVVTLCGRARNTVCNSSDSVPWPTNLPARPSIANPAAAAGITLGMFGMTVSSSLAMTNSSRSAGVALSGGVVRRMRSASMAASRWRVAAGRSSARATRNGTRNRHAIRAMRRR